MSTETPDRPDRSEGPADPKKPYVRPHLSRHGTVDDIAAATRPPEGTHLPLGAHEPSRPDDSDRNAKEGFVPVDPQGILARVATLPVETWSYKAERPAVRHIGPMAQDFAAAFGVGGDPTRIHAVDASGVALAAIQGLYQLVQAQTAELRELRVELRTLRAHAPEGTAAR